MLFASSVLINLKKNFLKNAWKIRIHKFEITWKQISVMHLI